MKDKKYSYIRTYTGLKFYPTEPDASMIEIKDIAHALSYICRGNGHVDRFYSVAQHCINCANEAMARGYSDKVALACLLHDAAEAYLSDVPRPIKQYLNEYPAMEKKITDIIFEKYLGCRLTENEKKQLKSIDDDLLFFDLKELLNEEDLCKAPLIKAPLDYKERSFKEVQDEYITMFNSLRQQV